MLKSVLYSTIGIGSYLNGLWGVRISRDRKAIEILIQLILVFLDKFERARIGF